MRQLAAGLRAPPVGLGRLDVLHPRAFLGLVRLRLRGGERGVGLALFRGDLGAVELEQRLPGLDPLALGHQQRRHPRGDLGRDVDAVGIGHALDQVGRAAEGQPQASDEDRGDNGQGDQAQPSPVRRRLRGSGRRRGGWRGCVHGGSTWWSALRT